MSKFDNIKIGDNAVINHLITHSDVEKFVQLKGDDNKINVYLV